MGAIIALPMTFLGNLFLQGEEQPGFTSQPRGIIEWLKRTVILLYLKYTKKGKPRRLDFYESPYLKEKYALGYKIPPEEWKLDAPRPFKKTDKRNTQDKVFFYGVNRKGACIVTRVVRRKGNQAEVWLYLKLEDGRAFEHVHSKPYNVLSDDQFTFRGGPLKMECREAMRRWRISFNGVMREIAAGEHQGKLIHMKFSFLWLNLSPSYDLDDDSSPKLMASQLAKESWSTIKQRLPVIKENIFSKEVERFEQAGQILGTYSIEGADEEELYLWGTRARVHDDGRRGSGSEPVIRAFGYDRCGSFFHIGFSFCEKRHFRFHYGYLLQSRGHLCPIESYRVRSLVMDETKSYPTKFEMDITATNIFYSSFESSINFNVREFGTKLRHHFGIKGKTSTYLIDCTLGRFQGKGVLLVIPGLPPCSKESESPFGEITNVRDVPLTVTLDDAVCRHVSVAGGKGASLAVLKHSSQTDKRFVVPDGIVVTTKAYKKILENEGLEEFIHNLEDVAWGRKQGNLEQECERVVKGFKSLKLPEEIRNAVSRKLREIYGDNLEQYKFAVRSSGSGEDSEDLSAAGQMDTFLGVQTLEKIFSAITSCWASQFGVVAVNYKKTNGQLINMEMAVVIQEMVASEVAGVMFTCNPINGDPRFIHITANYGLGESVVSASADPDTIMLERDYESNDIVLKNIVIGSKKITIQMGEEGTQEEEVSEEEASKCCVSVEKAILLGSIGVYIEEVFGSTRDIEWAIVKDTVYLLQARPVTSTDNETEFETLHSLDTGHMTDTEYWSKANVGEVMPGSLSPLGLPFVFKVLSTAFKSFRSMDERIQPGFRRNLFPGMGYSLYQVFVNLLEGDHELKKTVKSNAFTRSMAASMMGRPVDIDDENIDDLCSERRVPKRPRIILRGMLEMIKGHFTCDGKLDKARDEMWNEDISAADCKTAKEYFEKIGDYFIHCEKSILAFFYATMESMVFNCFVLTILSSGQAEISSEVYSNFASLMASCPVVESADVPAALKKLAAKVAKEIDPKVFKDMSPEEALQWIENSPSEAGRSFQEFIERHGHRCVKEFDVYVRPWRDDRSDLIRSVQAAVSLDHNTDKKEVTASEAISQLQVPLSWTKRLLLRLLLPRCRKAVSHREYGKSILVKTIDVFRRAFWRLAEMMAKEGYIPEKELMFFLNIEEIELLLKTRSPRLIARAKRRRKILPRTNELRFPEILKGAIRPPEVSAKPQNGYNASLTMTGVPVCRGVTKARARVANNLQEAAALQPGEILITYSTDIGWSPFFPVISGLATELGGLVSHGAVIAREYGLPCVISLHGATSVFRTGDLVVLDGTNGTLKKIDDDADAATTGF